MTSVVGRFCCKTPKMPFDQFPANRPNEPQSPIDVASRPLPKSPVSSSLDNVVPQSIVRSPRVRPGKFVFSHAKRLLQQNRHFSEVRWDRLDGCLPRNSRRGMRRCSPLGLLHRPHQLNARASRRGTGKSPITSAGASRL